MALSFYGIQVLWHSSLAFQVLWSIIFDGRNFIQYNVDNPFGYWYDYDSNEFRGSVITWNRSKSVSWAGAMPGVRISSRTKELYLHNVGGLLIKEAPSLGVSTWKEYLAKQGTNS